MPKRLPLTHETKARICENTSLKLQLYATKHDCSESAVVRKALKNFYTTCPQKATIKNIREIVL